MPAWHGSLRDFVRVLPQKTTRLVRDLQKAGVVEVHRDAKPLIRAMTPRGGILSRDKDPGRLKEAWKTVRGPDGSMKEVNDAPHAGVILVYGRKRGLTPRGQKRVRRRKVRGRFQRLKVNKAAPMLGSKQLPRGIKRPAVRMTLAHRPAILRRIYSKVRWAE